MIAEQMDWLRLLLSYCVPEATTTTSHGKIGSRFQLAVKAHKNRFDTLGPGIPAESKEEGFDSDRN